MAWSAYTFSRYGFLVEALVLVLVAVLCPAPARGLSPTNEPASQSSVARAEKKEQNAVPGSAREGGGLFGRDQSDGIGPDTPDVLWRMLAYVAVILVLGVVAFVVVKKVLPRIALAQGKGRDLRVGQTVFLAPKRSVHLIEAKGRHFLVGSTNESITLLAELTDGFDKVLGDQVEAGQAQAPDEGQDA